MISRCPSCAAEVDEDAAQCPSCYWDFAQFKRIPPKSAENAASPPPAAPAPEEAAKVEAPPPKPKTEMPGTGSARAKLQMYNFAEEELGKTQPPARPEKRDEKPAGESHPPAEVPQPKENATPLPQAPPPAPPVEFGQGMKAEPSFSIPALPPTRKPEAGYTIGSIPALPPVKRRSENPAPADLPELPAASAPAPAAKDPLPAEIPVSEPPAPLKRPEPKPFIEKTETEIPRTVMVKKVGAEKPAGKKLSTDPAARFRKKRDETAPHSRLKPEGAGEELPVRWLVGGLAVVALGGGLSIYFLTKPESTSTRNPVEAPFQRGAQPAAPPEKPAAQKKTEPTAAAPEKPVRKESPSPAPAPVEPPKPAKPALPEPAPAPKPAPEKPAQAAPERKAKASPEWVFEGRIYGLIDLESVYHAAVIVKDEAGKEIGRTVTADEGRYRIAVPVLPSGGYQISVEQPDYLGLYIDEISPPFNSMNRDERGVLKAGLSKAAARHPPWMGKTSKPTKRDLIMIPKASP